METERERIAKILQDALDAALQERDTKSQEFDQILAQIPSGLPHPDGVQRIKNASAALSLARDKMIEAMIRLREFTNRGITPEDLKKTGTEGGGRAGERSKQL